MSEVLEGMRTASSVYINTGPLYCPVLPPPLQMVTKYKLGYDPVEVDPEDMVGGSVFFLWGCW